MLFPADTVFFTVHVDYPYLEHCCLCDGNRFAVCQNVLSGHVQ